MKNLFDTYIENFEDKKKWKYYTHLESNPFNSIVESREFIARFIELSGKADENPLYKNIEQLEDKRIRHIISIFFLGIHLYNNSSAIKNPIDKVISRFKIQNPCSIIEFPFIWFLICLFHDLGYTIEETEKFKDFNEFINGKVKYFLNQRVGVPSLYERTYKNYFNYRLHSSNEFINKPDHGICGGILLFDELNSILKRKRLNNKSEGLSWNKKLINIYNYASWVILSHNIFFIRTGDFNEEEYLQNKLDELILSPTEKSKINLEKHSFLFLFLLVDSIDPIKIVDEYKNLKGIEIECIGNKIYLEIKDFSIRDDFSKKVLELKKWLIPKISIENNKITITIE